MAFNFEDSTNLFANMDLTAGTTTDPTRPNIIFFESLLPNSGIEVMKRRLVRQGKCGNFEASGGAMSYFWLEDNAEDMENLNSGSHVKTNCLALFLQEFISNWIEETDRHGQYCTFPQYMDGGDGSRGGYFTSLAMKWMARDVTFFVFVDRNNTVENAASIWMYQKLLAIGAKVVKVIVDNASNPMFSVCNACRCKYPGPVSYVIEGHGVGHSDLTCDEISGFFV
ncbi:ORF55, gene family 5 [White spot syndrome virus]|uniref:Wsv069 n=3 Tax=White spot syndrome virus TaxID=342409 RepID=Q77J89_WSSVS|nr:wsv069 [Shrimp white spot syndrome virus]YP_009220494.1 immediate-early protein [White spot syndrome virus]AYW76513.1 immediate-early protein [Procambarus clarkii virus]AAK77724.1 ORF55, gene family 5 [White spot syndrome virus]AAL33073.1 wsv069 [Shrimp white spot syndrome virus]AAL88994.1 WSSV126 [Shrimp white spot syndrome virus]AFX59446.1 wsv069 [White spot syndrome virus]